MKPEVSKRYPDLLSMWLFPTHLCLRCSSLYAIAWIKTLHRSSGFASWHNTTRAVLSRGLLCQHVVLEVICLLSTGQPAFSVYTEALERLWSHRAAHDWMRKGMAAVPGEPLWTPHQAHDVLNKCCHLCFWKRWANFLPLRLQLCESPSMRIRVFLRTAFTVIESLACVWTCWL